MYVACTKIVKVQDNMQTDFVACLRYTEHNFERDVRLTVLEKPPIHSLDSRESYWISTLDTVHPKGLNSRYE